jgi:oxygen-independent coproporphyrinogen-3 oxidase
MGEEDYLRRLEAADALGDAPLSVYVHLPFCEERCLFCACHVIIVPRREGARDVAGPYVETLVREMELVAARLPHRRKVAQLHLGGGTPTYLAVAELERLLGRFQELFELVPGAELAVEADPRVTSVRQLEVLAARGFNRISFGVQDFTREVQEAVGRVQSVEETATLAHEARRLGFRGVNVDLIYGLPHQQVETFERSIDEVLKLRPDRVAVYSFAFVPWMKGHQKTLPEDSFPDRSLKIALFAAARERFVVAGYEAIGMDHFALPDDELAIARREGRLRRNFMGYAVIPGQDVLGLGISAIGDVRSAYVQNEKKLSTYTAAIDAGRLPVHAGLKRSREDDLRRRVIHDLMCNFRVDRSAIEEAFSIGFGRHFEKELAALAPLEAEGLVTVDDEQIRATPRGQLFLRNLAMCFDAYLKRHEGGDRPVFSRTV